MRQNKHVISQCFTESLFRARHHFAFTFDIYLSLRDPTKIEGVEGTKTEKSLPEFSDEVIFHKTAETRAEIDLQVFKNSSQSCLT